MGSGPRKTSTEYVPPGVADGITVTCPETFTGVRVATRRSIVAGSEYSLSVATSGSILVGAPQTVATVVAAPDTLRIALAAGCNYVARFPDAVAGGNILDVEVLVE